MQKKVQCICLLIYLGLLIWLLFFFPYTHAPRTDRSLERSVNYTPLLNILYFTHNAVLHPQPNVIREFMANVPFNILLFIPMGWFAGALFRVPVAYILVFTALMSLALECLQYATHTGSFDVDDVLLNGLGGYAGGLLRVWYCRRQPAR